MITIATQHEHGPLQVFVRDSGAKRMRLGSLPANARQTVLASARENLASPDLLKDPTMFALLGSSPDGTPIAASFAGNPQGRLVALDLPSVLVPRLNLKDFGAVYPQSLNPTFVQLGKSQIQMHWNKEVESFWSGQGRDTGLDIA